MPRGEKFAWYKWWPGKARSSARWLTLTLAEEGYYRRLYDAAALSTPPSKRGWLYMNGSPMDLETVHKVLLIPPKDGRYLMERLMERGLIARNNVGAYGFPQFGKHQRDAGLRVRKDPAQPARKRRRKGTLLAQKGHTDLEAEADGEKEGLVNASSGGKPVENPLASEGVDGGWNSENWALSVSAAPRVWQQYIREIAADLVRYPPPVVLAWILKMSAADRKPGRKTPKNAGQVKTWILHRLKSYDPGDKWYTRAKEMLR